MIRIEGGEVTIGATDEQIDDAENNEMPAHSVTLSTFYIGQFPVTQNIWELVMGYNKSNNKEKRKPIGNSLIPKVSSAAMGTAIKSVLGTPISGIPGLAGAWWTAIKDGSSQKKDDAEGHYPVENISYDEAVDFVRRLSNMTKIKFALPTEEEWEYAARGGQKCQGYKYSGSNDIDEVAWYKDNAGGTTHPVGEKKPNELGIYDMSGNVWEWTETNAHSYVSDAESDDTIFIRRGGSWWHEAKNCRVSRRYASEHTKKTSGLGLRVVIRENVK